MRLLPPQAEAGDGEEVTLPIVLGHTAEGPVRADLAELPHLLVGGTTGSGKSVFIHSLMMDLLTGSDARFLMIDPKRVELAFYAGSPRLVRPPIVQMADAAWALDWAKMQMELRFTALAVHGLRDWKQFEPARPRLVIVIDELANLILENPGVEHPLVAIASQGRAAGVHLVVATQRPSADVLTGLLRANVPARAAFATVTSIESRIILDVTGAELLKGKGDMLFRNGTRLMHMQGRYVPDEQIIKTARGTAA